MAFSLNIIILAGNVARDPELKYTPKGTAICTLSVATNHWVPGQNGQEGKSIPTFHRVVVWGKMGEAVAGSVRKGTAVTIQGRQENRQFDKQDGTKGYISEVVADTVIYPKAVSPGGQVNDPGLPPEPGTYAPGMSPSEVADDMPM